MDCGWDEEKLIKTYNMFGFDVEIFLEMWYNKIKFKNIPSFMAQF